MPEPLLSLGYFPDTNASNDILDFRVCKRLHQIQTRLNENCNRAIAFLNQVRHLTSVFCVAFENIRQHQKWLSEVELSTLETWDGNNTNHKNFKVIINPDDLILNPIIIRIFPIRIERFFPRDSFDFLDCPFWSKEAIEFIQMTKHRKLLLR
ncbi:hypothetical protein RFI_37039 [Reticulomyxa filosa]|nr:hypothetical protein RFI_37039 [Reticulomyxa filosa]|eukprot:ETO00407.1 hypothetical protein RFI_37039 [Reticulomyxa filosa]